MNDEKGAMDFFRKVRWADGVFCPICKSTNIKIPKFKLVPEKNTKINPHVRSYYCIDCKKDFNDFKGTEFYGRKVPIGKVLYIIANEKTKTYEEIADDIGFSRQTVSDYINNVLIGSSLKIEYKKKIIVKDKSSKVTGMTYKDLNFEFK